MEYQNALTELLARLCNQFRPPPDLTLSEWADRNAMLSPESGGMLSRWRTIPYQRAIMDAMTDRDIEQVTVMKSARVGYTKMVNNLVGMHIDIDPSNILLVQPTLEDADGYSKDELAPMIRDTPALRDKVADPKSRDGSNTLRSKSFPGGKIYLVGANSPRGFRRISARIIVFDEVDGYPASAGTEGDQIRLGKMRGQGFWDRKVIMGSTPLIKGESKIEAGFEEGDKRQYWVPCPHCGEYQTLKWSNIQWPKGKPELAYYVCEHNGCVIEHREKQGMIEKGQWIAEQPFNGHASFYIWAGYSYMPKAAWGVLAREWLEAQRDSEALQTFTNTILGETWEEEAIKLGWEALYERRYDYDKPAGGSVILTAGVDVQQDWLEMLVEGHNADGETFTVEHIYLYGDTSKKPVWDELSQAFYRTYENDAGQVLSIHGGLVDSGYRTDFVYSFCRKNEARRIYASKGIGGAGHPIAERARKKKVAGEPYPVRLFIIGVDAAKSIIYHQLKLNEPGPGYRHFHSGLTEEFFEGLTAEKVVTKKKRGFEYREWHKIRPRNEPLDLAVLNYAAIKIFNPTWQALENPNPSPEPPPRKPPPAGLQRRGGSGNRRR